MSTGAGYQLRSAMDVIESEILSSGGFRLTGAFVPSAATIDESQTYPRDAVFELLSDEAGIDSHAHESTELGDLMSLLNAWGMCPTAIESTCVGDLTTDGFVDEVDLVQLIEIWNSSQ